MRGKKGHTDLQLILGIVLASMLLGAVLVGLWQNREPRVAQYGNERSQTNALGVVALILLVPVAIGSYKLGVTQGMAQQAAASGDNYWQAWRDGRASVEGRREEMQKDAEKYGDAHLGGVTKAMSAVLPMVKEAVKKQVVQQHVVTVQPPQLPPVEVEQLGSGADIDL